MGDPTLNPDFHFSGAAIVGEQPLLQYVAAYQARIEWLPNDGTSYDSNYIEPWKFGAREGDCGRMRRVLAGFPSNRDDSISIRLSEPANRSNLRIDDGQGGASIDEGSYRERWELKANRFSFFDLSPGRTHSHFDMRPLL